MVRARDLVGDGRGRALEAVLAGAAARSVALAADEATCVEAGRSVQGEVWSPQLLPFKPWTHAASSEGAHAAPDAHAGADTAGRAPAGAQAGTDGDLLVVGARGMGISDEERERLLAEAAHARGVGGSAAVRVPVSAAAAGAQARAEADVLRDAIAVRRDAGGYALVAFDLRALAAAAGVDPAAGAIVRVPASVGGVPIVRIAAEAFARRFVRGVRVDALVIPDTVERIGPGAFAALPGRHIHLGAGVRSGGAQPCDLAGVSPRLERRTYSVAAGNPQYRARGGSLFSRDGAQLLFLAPPYASDLALPPEVERVGEHAFCAGCEPPRCVRAGERLARVDARAFDDAVWVCPPAAPVRASLVKRGVRLASPRVREAGGCWYDVDGEEAVLVAGPVAPKSASARFAAHAAQAVASGAVQMAGETSRARAEANAAHGQMSGGTLGPVEDGPAAAAVQATREQAATLELPRTVGGLPLARIAPGALPRSPQTLVVPDTVRAIGDGNACKGAKRLVLPAGLATIGAHCFCSRILEGPVLIPASVRGIGEGSFEYAVCRFEATGDVVHVSADQLLSCFLPASPAGTGVPFDFARYDESLREGRTLPDGTGALLHRLAAPHALAPRTREAIVAQLKAAGRAARERVAQEGDVAMVARLVEAGFIDEASFDGQIELLRACNRTDCVAYLMEWMRARREARAEDARGDAAAATGKASAQASGAGRRTSSRDRFAL